MLDHRVCEACGECVAVCPQSVIGLIRFLGHKHAVLRRPEECRGCLKCVKVCETGALVPVKDHARPRTAAFSSASRRP